MSILNLLGVKLIGSVIIPPTFVGRIRSNFVSPRLMILSSIKWLRSRKYFDEEPHMAACPEDLNLKLADELFHGASKPFSKRTAHSLGLLVKHQDKDYPSNGGLLLFAKNREYFFPDAVIRCARFSGTTKTKFLDQLECRVFRFVDTLTLLDST